MASEHFSAPVKSYSVYRYAGVPSGQMAAIHIALDGVEEGDPQELRVVFYKSGAPLPASEYEKDTQTGFAYEHIEEYAVYIDLLRNEAPLQVTFGLESTPPYFVVSCRDEEPGEGRSRPRLPRP